MRRRWGRRADKVMAHYPLARFANQSTPTITQSYIEADADERIVCPTRHLALSASHASTRGTASAPSSPVQVYTYVYTHLALGCDASFELQMLPWWGKRSALAGSDWASHGSDNMFVFHTTHGGDDLSYTQPEPRMDCPFDDQEEKLSDDMGAR